MNRAELLTAALETVTNDRQATHGSPEDTFGTIAEMWSVYLDKSVASHDVAAMMVLFKVARIKANPNHTDNWLDTAGYAACGSELSQSGKQGELYV